MASFKDFLKEGFKNKVGGGKVPIGEFTFIYEPKSRSDVEFIINSAKIRKGAKVKAKGKIVTITANATVHDSLIASFQSLGLNGEVREE
jgi:hypothetical protein